MDPKSPRIPLWEPLVYTFSNNGNYKSITKSGNRNLPIANYQTLAQKLRQGQPQQRKITTEKELFASKAELCSDSKR